MQPDTLGLHIDVRDAARFVAADTAGVTFSGVRNRCHVEKSETSRRSRRAASVEPRFCKFAAL